MNTGGYISVSAGIRSGKKGKCRSLAVNIKGVTAPAAETVFHARPDAHAIAVPAIILIRNYVRADAVTAHLAVQADISAVPAVLPVILTISTNPVAALLVIRAPVPAGTAVALAGHDIKTERTTVRLNAAKASRVTIRTGIIPAVCGPEGTVTGTGIPAGTAIEPVPPECSTGPVAAGKALIALSATTAAVLLIVQGVYALPSPVGGSPPARYDTFGRAGALAFPVDAGQPFRTGMSACPTVGIVCFQAHTGIPASGRRALAGDTGTLTADGILRAGVPAGATVGPVG